MIRKHEVDDGAETVEPILDSFGGYSTDNLSNFYYPYILFLLMIFRDEVRVFRTHLGRTTMKLLFYSFLVVLSGVVVVLVIYSPIVV